MNKHQIAHEYQKLYCEMGFDRAMLFEAISKKYKCTHVLYPGSAYYPIVLYRKHTMQVSVLFQDRLHAHWICHAKNLPQMGGRQIFHYMNIKKRRAI